MIAIGATLKGIPQGPSRDRSGAKRRSLLGLVMSVAASCSNPPPPLGPPAALPEPAGPPPVVVDSSWRSERPASGEPSHVEFPPTVAATLENGLQLYLVRRPSAVVSLTLSAGTGSASLAPEKVGASALAARLLTEEARKLPGNQLVEAVEALGTSLSEQAGRESTSLELEVLRQDVDRGMALLAEVVQRPLFDSKTFDRVRKEWLDNLRSERQNPQRLASLAGVRLVLDDSLGLPANGTPSRVEALTTADLQQFHRRAFTPNNCAVIVVGDVDLATAHAALKQHFDGWKAAVQTRAAVHKPRTAGGAQTAGNSPQPSVTTATVRPPVHFIDRPGAVQTAVFVGQRFPGRNLPGTEARQVMNNALGGLFSARLNHNLREQHAYTYGAYSSVLAARDWGLFIASTSVKTEVTSQALNELLGEIGRVKSATGQLTEPEVARAKSDLIRNLGASLEQVGSTASTIEGHFIYGLPLDYFERLPTTWAQIDLSAAQAQTAQLNLDDLQVVLVGDRSTTEPALQQAGYSIQEFPMATLD